MIDGRRARLGRAGFVGVTGAGSETELWFGFDGDTRIKFRFADTLRPDAAAVVADLIARGLTLEVLSGDLEAPVARAAEMAGITVWRAGCTPQDKAARIDDRSA